MTVQGCFVVDSQDLAGLRSRQERRMTRNKPSGTDATRTSPERTPRLRLKPKALMCGYVDGAWWPHSDDLATELPDLLAVLSVRLGRIDRVLYNVNEWAKPPRKLFTGGRAVRLDGYQLQPAHTLEVIGLGRTRIVLLVVPANTGSDEAHAMLMAAASPGNDATVGDLLTLTAP
jgi:hypothetical protein